MELNYLEYRDLCNALSIAICRTKYYINTAKDKDKRKEYENREKRYQKILRKLRHCAGEKTENRCHKCTEQKECPAYDTGVIYPCPYFKEVL